MPGMYDSLTQPLTTAPSRWGQVASNFILNREKDPNDQWFLLPRAMAAGAMEGAGDLASNLTSPVNLAATALTGGAGGAAKAGLPTIASGLRGASRLASLPVAYEGAKTVADPSKSITQRAMGSAQIAAGLAGARPSSKLARDKGVRSLVKDERSSPITRPSRTIPQRPTELGRILQQLRAQSANEPHAAKVQRATDLMHESMGKSGKAPRNPWDELFNDETGSIGPRPSIGTDPEVLFKNKIAIIEDTGPKWIGAGAKGEDLFNVAIPRPSGASGKIELSHGILTPEDEASLINEGFKLIRRSELK